MGGSRAPKLSGIQKQVLSLYRCFLRTTRSKPQENRAHMESIISGEFRKNSKLIDRKDFLHIEYLLRRGKKQLDQLKTVDSVTLSSSNLDSTKS
ncbi:succinate dehydrogenase assembly factor 1, mitochondrial [Lactuca sativa]|uniref:succinate dehydrogenase assembly factor 1, mitochondrial n=1 Tax=Lactuca sativa TaxID=4236 RepID=UPI000CD8F620|nr:succinate dehydrogenase assembly factor 1, mitochondrial [Lactuca sativa]XP_042756706.1 succinate dehydrogenase assembly factor 1, mitochondrial [Lactuca sativa]